MNANAESNLLVSLLPLVVLFAVFYFFLIRPQRVQAKRHKEMLESLKKGDTKENCYDKNKQSWIEEFHYFLSVVSSSL